MQVRYLNISLNILKSELYRDMRYMYNSFNINSFYKEKRNIRIIFGVYIGYLVIVSVLFWIFFISKIQKELWKTKSILSILPLDLIMNISEIKTYILNNSSMVVFLKTKI